MLTVFNNLEFENFLKGVDFKRRCKTCLKVVFTTLSPVGYCGGLPSLVIYGKGKTLRNRRNLTFYYLTCMWYLISKKNPFVDISVLSSKK